MVRLKEEMQQYTYARDNKFQFLMVRLKEDRQKYFDLVREISIPYGAIKSSKILNAPLEASTISIPYGAIKRNLAKHYC